MSIDFSVVSVPAYLLVFARFAAMFAFNPFFSRAGVPAAARVILTVSLTLIMAPIAPFTAALTSSLALLAALLREVLIGAALGFVFTVFFYSIYFAGDFLDMQMGVSMAKVMDPATRVQSSVSSAFFTTVLGLLFFVTDSHLVTVHLFASSFFIAPVGGGFDFSAVPMFIITLFSSTFSMALRLVLPIAAAEFVVEMGMGILMKLIPQIHVFVINIQIKLILGIGLMFLFASPISTFLDNYIDEMLTQAQNLLTLIGV